MMPRECNSHRWRGNAASRGWHFWGRKREQPNCENWAIEVAFGREADADSKIAEMRSADVAEGI